MPSFLLVHSPLLGPSSWRAVAGLLGARGSEVAVPDLTGVTDAGSGSTVDDLLRRAVVAGTGLPPPVVVVGHSGAGAFLPAVGDGLGGAPAALVFVDAVLPPRRGAHVTSPDLVRLLDANTVDGRLRPWLDWWPEDTVARLLPDADDRHDLRRDMPRTPRALYDEAVAVPDGWSAWRCAYLRLSRAYDDEYEEAGARGWPRRSLDADHLATVTRPDLVVDAIDGLLGEAGV